MLENIRIVLVRTYHPGNIGSAARAMKTMGLSDLALVNPVDFPSDEAVKMAVSADDLLQTATTYNSLFDAVKDCSVVVASTARSRSFDLPEILPEQSAEMLYSASKKSKVALVFGPERMGLLNDDLQFAKYRVTIPTSSEYSSLNLASAVQLLSYEIFKQSISQSTNSASQNKLENEARDLPSTEQMETYYNYLEETLATSGFLRKKHPGDLMLKLRTLFSRAQPDKIELNILRGMFASIEKKNMSK